jgi:hypothetical protein
MLLASAPARDGAVSGIRDGVGDTGAAEPLAQAATAVMRLPDGQAAISQTLLAGILRLIAEQRLA